MTNLRMIESAQKALQSIQDIDLSKYVEREERSRVIPAEALAEEGRRRMLLGRERDVGLSLPWDKTWDKILIKPGKFVVWCGWSHHGKSQMLKQLMVHALSQGEKVCIASMEEEIADVWEEMGYLAMATRFPAPSDIDDWCKFFSPKLWFYDQQGRIKPEKVKAVIRYASEELAVTQFVIDSLMMIGVSREDYESQAQFIADLATLAKDTHCTIHLVAHMRKTDSLTGESKPGAMHDISGGHEISSIADSIFQVWRDKSKNGEWPAILKVEKQRGSVNWIGTLGLGYDANSRQYTNEVGGRAKQYCGKNECPL